MNFISISHLETNTTTADEYKNKRALEFRWRFFVAAIVNRHYVLKLIWTLISITKQRRCVTNTCSLSVRLYFLENYVLQDKTKLYKKWRLALDWDDDKLSKKVNCDSVSFSENSIFEFDLKNMWINESHTKRPMRKCIQTSTFFSIGAMPFIKITETELNEPLVWIELTNKLLAYISSSKSVDSLSFPIWMFLSFQQKEEFQVIYVRMGQ